MQNLYFDYSGMDLSGDFSALEKVAKEKMKAILSGKLVNDDEKRMVGHYWLRNPFLSPTKEIENAVLSCNKKIAEFVSNHRYKYAIVCGIGGSSLGAEFISKCLEKDTDKTKLFFLDNTDPDGMDKVFNKVKDNLNNTLAVVISKSGGTIETRNAMLECENFYKSNNVDFASHAVCVTGENSKLYNIAKKNNWLDIFPMWDYIGGRTSVMSAVGLLPLSLQGIDTISFLKGASTCDKDEELALTMAKCWYSETKGKGGKTLVILPYKDSLSLFAKYLQQLIMESLGKEKDDNGNIVHQGLAVMGNKGTSDQHSYCQQLVAGPNNIFVTFIEVLKDRNGESINVGENSTSGDYLNAFMLGTKKALESHGKHTMTLSIPEVNEYYLGALISVFERAVSYYAAMININAYNQPAVEYGKKCAGELIELKNRAIAYLAIEKTPKTAAEIAAALDADENDIYNLLLHQSFNGKINGTADDAGIITEFSVCN